MKAITIISILLILSIHSITFAQSTYAIHFVNGELDSILTKANQKLTADDYYWLSMTYNELNNKQEAITNFEEGLSKFPQDEKLQKHLSELYFESGNYIQAKAILIKIENKGFKEFQSLIKIYEFEGNYKESIHLLEQVLLNDSTNRWALIQLGINFQSQKNNNAAKKYYQQALSLNPEDQRTTYRLAKLYQKEGIYDSTMIYCSAILVNDSLNPKFIKLNSNALYSNKHFSEAKIGFQKLAQMGDTSDFVMKHLAICEIKGFNYDEAKLILDKLSLRIKDDFEIYYYLSKCCQFSGDIDLSLKYLATADSLLQPDPSTLEIIEVERAVIYDALEDYGSEIQAYNNAYKFSSNPEYLFQIAVIYQRKEKKPEDALKYYKLFLKHFPEKPAEDLSIEGQLVFSLDELARQSVKQIEEELFFRNAEKK